MRSFAFIALWHLTCFSFSLLLNPPFFFSLSLSLIRRSRFDTDSFGLIRKLVQIIQMTPASPIQTAEDCEKLSVACFDVGEFARLYPTGKSIIKDLNGLAVVMELIRCTNEEVSKAALLCSSKIMIAKWQFVELTK